MNKYKIRTGSDPILKVVCDPVETLDISDIVGMKTVLRGERYGVGLSAPQVGITKRIIAIQADRRNPIKIMINPEIVDEGTEVETFKEGCLSYPGIYKEIERKTHIVVIYQDEDMKIQKGEFTHFEARIVLHEMDHLNGICLVGQ